MPLDFNVVSSQVALFPGKDLIDTITAALKLIYGGDPPVGVLKLLGYLILAGLVLTGIFGLLTILHKIADLWITKFWPLFYNHEKKQRAFFRRKFAADIERELHQLDRREEWKDYRFAELEAEVNAEGRRRLLGVFPHFGSRTTLRQEPSLSKALRNSKERRILVEGDPGSGKSVALRHAAQELARRAMRSRGLKTVIPIYLNLKELERAGNESIDRNFIHSFVLKTLTRGNDRDIEKFLEEEFDQGIKDGAWVFFFDSFDEIPEVLSSIEADTAIQQYAEAIAAFLGGFNSCRGITASRYFRGPRQFEWPRFRILPLNPNRRFELIRRAGLKPDQQKKLRTQLLSADPDMWAMASNPMFLSLLCAHIRDENPFPENGYSLYESYMTSRFKRDAERLQRHYNLDVQAVRATAETMAFCMTADFRLGLSPTREHLKESAVRLGFHLNEPDKTLDALEYIKLARSETAMGTAEKHQFTFGHRRFQEYFATCVVLREPDRLSPSDLLGDARWRETAVVMCQTQESGVLEPLIDEAQARVEAFEKKIVIATAEFVRFDRLQIPAACFHILGLLQEGFNRRMNLLPDDLRNAAADLLSFVSRNGSLRDRKAALEVSGVMPHDAFKRILRREFPTRSFWLREVAFRQVARLTRIPEDISRQIQNTLIVLLALGRLHKERGFIQAHLARLDQAERFVSTLHLLIWLRRFDLFLIGLAFCLTLFQGYDGANWSLSSLLASTLLFLLLVTSQSILSVFILWSKTVLLRAVVQVLILRALLAGAVSLIIVSKGVPISSRLGLGTLLYCWVIWAPFALYTASTRGFKIRRLLWPILPLLPISIVLTDLLKAIAKGIYTRLTKREDKVQEAFKVRTFAPSTTQRKLSVPTLWEILKIVIVPLRGIVEEVGYMWRREPRRLLTSALGYLVTPGLLLLLSRYPKVGILLAGTVAVTMLGVYLTPIGMDWMRLRAYQRKRLQMSGADLIQLLAWYNTDPFRIRLLRYVRVENLVVPDRETIEQIENLGWDLERDFTETEAWAGLASKDMSRRIRGRWFSSVADTLRNNADVVDEIYRLLEQLTFRASESTSHSVVKQSS